MGTGLDRLPDGVAVTDAEHALEVRGHRGIPQRDDPAALRELVRASSRVSGIEVSQEAAAAIAAVLFETLEGVRRFESLDLAEVEPATTFDATWR